MQLKYYSPKYSPFYSQHQIMTRCIPSSFNLLFVICISVSQYHRQCLKSYAGRRNRQKNGWHMQEPQDGLRDSPSNYYSSAVDEVNLILSWLQRKKEFLGISLPFIIWLRSNVAKFSRESRSSAMIDSRNTVSCLFPNKSRTILAEIFSTFPTN